MRVDDSEAKELVSKTTLGPTKDAAKVWASEKPENKDRDVANLLLHLCSSSPPALCEHDGNYSITSSNCLTL